MQVEELRSRRVLIVSRRAFTKSIRFLVFKPGPVSGRPHWKSHTLFDGGKTWLRLLSALDEALWKYCVLISSLLCTLALKLFRLTIWLAKTALPILTSVHSLRWGLLLAFVLGYCDENPCPFQVSAKFKSAWTIEMDGFDRPIFQNQNFSWLLYVMTGKERFLFFAGVYFHNNIYAVVFLSVLCRVFFRYFFIPNVIMVACLVLPRTLWAFLFSLPAFLTIHKRESFFSVISYCYFSLRLRNCTRFRWDFLHCVFQMWFGNRFVCEVVGNTTWDADLSR